MAVTLTQVDLNEAIGSSKKWGLTFSFCRVGSHRFSTDGHLGDPVRRQHSVFSAHR